MSIGPTGQGVGGSCEGVLVLQDKVWKQIPRRQLTCSVIWP